MVYTKISQRCEGLSQTNIKSYMYDFKNVILLNFGPTLYKCYTKVFTGVTFRPITPKQTITLELERI